MGLIFLKDGKTIPPELDITGADSTFEWINGQFWLHSDDPKERPIGIEIDKILDRHLEYFRKSSVHKELFARAIGIKGAFRPRLVDLGSSHKNDRTEVFPSNLPEKIHTETSPAPNL